MDPCSFSLEGTVFKKPTVFVAFSVKYVYNEGNMKRGRRYGIQ